MLFYLKKFKKKSQLHTLEEIPTRKMNADSQQNSRKEGRKKKENCFPLASFSAYYNSMKTI